MKIFMLLVVAIGVLISVLVSYLARDADNIIELIQGRVVRLKRNEHGIFVGSGETLEDLARALGYAHAADRFSQMDIQRVVGKSRLAEVLVDSPGARNMDIFFHQLGFSEDARRSVKNLDEATLKFMTAYTSGVNKYLYGFNDVTGSPSAKRTLDMIIAGRSIEPWTMEDTIVCGKLLSYVGLASLHLDFENLLLDVLKQGKVDVSQLKAIYSPFLDNVGDTVRLLEVYNISMLRDKQLAPTLSDITRLSGLSFKASNNWVVSTDGSSVMSFDPHLEVHRLPSVWYEMSYNLKGNPIFGISVPGIPILLMGRNSDISWSFTYGFMDQIDAFVEEIRDGKFKRGDNWIPLTMRREAIQFKSEKGKKHDLFFYESDIGTVERYDVFNPSSPSNGFYKVTSWTNQYNQVACNIVGGMKLVVSKTAPEAMSAARQFSVSLNFLVGDKNGNIGYQQTGNAPIRASNSHGLLPLPAWDTALLWKPGFVPADQLTSVTKNEGWIVTANNDWQNKVDGSLLTLNLHMGEYRSDRIHELLAGLNGNYSTGNMASIQHDIVSNQAKRFMKVLGPMIPPSDKFFPLNSWNLSYHDCIESRLFEDLYDGLLTEIIGKGVIKDSEYFVTKLRYSPMVVAFFIQLDNFMLKRIQQDPSIVKSVLASLSTASIRPRHTYDINNVYTDGQLPDFLGFDVPNVFMPGDRATVSQGQIWKEAGRVHTFGPSYRAVVDMRLKTVFASFPGGVSGNPLSKLYKSSLNHHLNNMLRAIQFG